MKPISYLIAGILLSILGILVLDFTGIAHFLDYIEYFIVFLELTLVTRLILTIIQLRRQVNKSEQIFLVDLWKEAVTKSLGNNRAVEFIASELLMVYFAFFSWFKSSPKYDLPSFSYTKKGTQRYMLGVVIFLSFFEVPLIHLLLERVNPVLAWVVTGISIYGILWIIGDFRLMQYHPILLSEKSINIRVGLRWAVDIEYTQIRELSKRKPKEDEDALKLTPDTSEKLLIHLHEPVIISGLFGITKSTQLISLSVDEPDEFYQLFNRFVVKSRKQPEEVVPEISP